MRTFKAFSNPEIFITGSIEPSLKSPQSQLINFKNDLNDFCRIINFIRQDKRWIAVINPSDILKNMLNNVDLDTKQIIMVYPNDKSRNIDIVCRALACGNCGAVISNLDEITDNDYGRLKNAAYKGDSIAYIISKIAVESKAQVAHSVVSESTELSIEDDLVTASELKPNTDNVVKFSKKKGVAQSSFEF